MLLLMIVFKFCIYWIPILGVFCTFFPSVSTYSGSGAIAIHMMEILFQSLLWGAHRISFFFFMTWNMNSEIKTFDVNKITKIFCIEKVETQWISRANGTYAALVGCFHQGGYLLASSQVYFLQIPTVHSFVRKKEDGKKENSIECKVT